MRKRKLMWVFISILAVIGMAVGGWAMHQHQEKQKMIQIANSKEAKKVYERKIKKEDSKAFTSTAIIKTYKIDENSLEYNSMGGLMVTIIINGNNKLSIDFNLIDNGDGTYHSAYYGISAKLGDLLGYK
ncbi:DUF1310 family protein [Streptococcus intermedius]|uniref:DUF1310 family protein n=1 Tax=Streptococcus intermedius TaxID=1338 RepID=A0A3R9LK28_STRIT|nr:DUF1310 family protein [Streptococcus intermedius]EKU16539.1 hypothetical protein D593_1723 [Streptococcus intermedius BA1]MBF1712385.1 DUF1310 family protein [Streptococcus intermedius]RSJ18699.1 hypothetical protein D8829_09310 [Streptococcus intermedius]BAW17773.1 hypothetical protein SITYG_17960 [Streptococcus intermedius]